MCDVFWWLLVQLTCLELWGLLHLIVHNNSLLHEFKIGVNLGQGNDLLSKYIGSRVLSISYLLYFTLFLTKEDKSEI